MTMEPIKRKSDLQRMIAFLEKRNTRDALLFRMGINTILRISDIVKLRVCDIKHNNGSFRQYLSLNEQKTSKLKKIALNKLIRLEIQNHINKYKLEGEDYLFFSLRNPTKAIDRTNAWRTLKKASNHCGIENFGTHSMRKTLAYHIYAKTKNIALVQKLLNHTSPSVTLKYIGVDQEEMDKAYNDFQL